MSATNASFIPLILFSVFTNFLSQIMLKKGMSSHSNLINDFADANSGFSAILSVALNPFVIGGLVVMVISMSSHLLVLSKVDISYAYPFLGLSFALVTLYGFWILGEQVPMTRVIGVALIIGGVILVSRN